MNEAVMWPDNPENPKFSTTYNTMLFQVVTHFTNIEYLLRSTYRRKTGLDKAKFDILFGIPALGSMLSRMIKLFKHEPHPKHQDAILGALSQLQSISRLRNWMVHAGGHGLDSGFDFLVRLNPNERSSKTGKDYHIFPITTFMDVHKDLNMITAIIAAVDDDSFPLSEQYALENYGEPTTTYNWKFKIPGIEAA